MKLSLLFLLIAFLNVNAAGYSQTVTFSGKHVPLEKVFIAIKKQTGFAFFYSDDQLQNTKNVTINVKNVTVEEVLNMCMKDQPYDYTIKEKTVFLVEKTAKGSDPASLATDEKKEKRVNIMGKVVGEKEEPIIGATVAIKKSNVITSTNEKGEFFLSDVDENATLIVSNVSYQMQEVPLKGRTSLTVQLKINVGNLDEAVVVAYNTTTQRRNTGSVTVVKGEAIQNLPNRSFDRSLQGLVPGLLVTPGTGQPGGGTSNFVIRGIATSAEVLEGSTVRNPLIIVDGVPVSQDHTQLYIFNRTTPYTNPLAQLNPSDIESISVLKDAAAIALYGAKASNGVILITTKKGKAGKVQFTFRHQSDISMIANNGPEPLNQEQYLELLYETYKNTPRVIGGVTTAWTDADILSDLRSKFPVIVKAPGDTSFYTQDDWEVELFKNNALTISNDLSISGGNDRSNYYLNFEYTKQNGVLKSTGFERKSARFNFENRPTFWLKFGVNSTVSHSIQDYGGAAKGGGGSPAGVLLMSPLNPIRDVNGDYILHYMYGGPSFNAVNPAAAAEYNTNRNTAYRGLSKFYGEISFLKDFRFNANVGFDFMLSEAKEKADPRLRDPGLDYVAGGRVEELDVRRSNIISTNILRYDHTFKQDHVLGIIIGQEAQILNQKVMSIGVQGLRLPYYDQINSPGSSILRYGGSTLKETLLSYFGQANYSYKNKYLLSASIRRDGSSRFGEDKRFGTYWSTGAGWIITSEPFAKSMGSWLNFFKIRGSIGAAGNAGAIDRFTPYTRVSVGNYLGNTAVYSISAPAGNHDVEWENTLSWDAGMEARFIKERIAITADIYQRNTSNLIYSINIPGTTGYSVMPTNIGKMRNAGVEFSLSANIIRSQKFSWNLSGNWSTNSNKLIKSNVPTASLAGGVTANMEGKPFNSYYIVRWAGVNPADGSPQWYDSTGKPNSDYTAAKPEFVGKPQPDGFGSVTNRISYKNIEFSVMLYYQYGFEIYDYSGMSVSDGYNPYKNAGTNSLNRWQKPGDIAANPKRILNNFNPTEQLSTRYLFKGDHIRLQNITIGYSFPNRVINRLHMTSLRIFAQGNNLALWSINSDYDPSTVDVTGMLSLTYPMQRSFSLGLQVNF